MTEYELASLIVDTRSSMMEFLMFWITASTSVVLIAQFLQSNLEQRYRLLIAIVYVFMALSTIFGYLQSLLEILDYQHQLTTVRGLGVSRDRIGDIAAGLGVFVYFLGTVGALYFFFWRTSRVAENT